MMKVSIGGQVSVLSINVQLAKDLFGMKLSSDVTFGVGSIPLLGSVASGGGNFSLDQRTGIDSSSMNFKFLIFTLLQKAFNTTQLFSIATPPATVVPPPISSPNFPTPKIRSGGSPGFNSSNPNQHGYDSGYVRVTPEPASIDLCVVGLLVGGVVAIARSCAIQTSRTH